MHVVLAIEELGGIYGGVERTVVNLTNYLHGLGWQVTILTSEHPACESPVYPLSPGINRVNLALIPNITLNERNKIRRESKRILPNSIVRGVQNLFALKRLLSAPLREIPKITSAIKSLDPDVVISFKSHFHRYIVPAANRAGVPVVASEHNPPEIIYQQYFCTVDRLVVLHYLKYAEAIRVLIEEFRDFYPKTLASKIEVIPNGIKIVETETVSMGSKNQKIIINVGRLYFQKDQKTLVRAFSSLADRYPDWNLEIYGDGEEEGNLRNEIKKCGLQDRVFLMGVKKDIAPFYRRARFFALPSLFEGFGNVVIEAFSSGIPVIGFDDLISNRILIGEDKRGVLVSTEDRVRNFSQAMETLMNDEEKCQMMGLDAREFVEKNYEFDSVMNRWVCLIEKIANIT